MTKSHEQQRKQLWCQIAIACTSASNSTEVSLAVKWADCVLKAFDTRFPKPTEETKQEDDK